MAKDSAFCLSSICTPAELLAYSIKHRDELSGDLQQYASALSNQANAAGGIAAAEAASSLGLGLGLKQILIPLNK